MFEEKRHPIRVVARRTGLSPEVIRVWERRYGTISPARTSTGRRVYSDADIERLGLVRQATQHGRRIGDVCHLSLDDLNALVREDGAAEDHLAATESASASEQTRGPQKRQKVSTDSPFAKALLDDAMRAVYDLDGAGLEATLNRGLMGLGSADFIDTLIAPLMRTIGDHWERGRLDVSTEHLATAVVRQTIARRLIWPAAEASAPLVVVATPAGQAHELGAVLAASAAQSQGWRVLYLGADLPAEDIARAAARAQAAAVALSLVYPVDDPRLHAELSKLRTDLPKETAILAGGPAVDSYEAVLSHIGAETVDDMETFRRVLSRLAVDRSSQTQPS